MAYSQMPGYPVYQNPYSQPYQDRLAQLQNQYQQIIPQAQAQPQTNQGFIWVQGEAGAKSYLVAPNTTVLLMDADAQRFYMKSTDAYGVPSLKTFEFSEVVQTHLQTVPQVTENLDNKYVTRIEYDGLLRRYEEIMNKLNAFQPVHMADKQHEPTETKPARSNGGYTDEQPTV